MVEQLWIRKMPVSKSFFFYGIYEGNEGDETWRVLHEHFEKLKKEDEKIEAEFTDSKARNADKND
jgi:hypothetical protein